MSAVDLLELDGEDVRREPLETRKARLQRLLAGQAGVRLSEHIEGDGPIIFEHACRMGLEGIVSETPGPTLPQRSSAKLDQDSRARFAFSMPVGFGRIGAPENDLSHRPAHLGIGTTGQAGAQ